MVNLQNAVESRLEGAERTDFTGKMVPGSSFFSIMDLSYVDLS